MRVVDETGNTHARLRVLERYYPEQHGEKRYNTQAQWLCECQCGTKMIVSGCLLRAGKVRSCGCLRRDTLRKLAAERKKK